ncbi:hypothetical protein [Streptomyces sp. NPDC054797]
MHEPRGGCRADGIRTVPLTDLVPGRYVWADHQLDAEHTASPGAS